MNNPAIATGQESRPQTAQVLPCREHTPRTNKVVQEEAGGLLYALLFVLRCNFYVAVTTAAIPHQLISASMAHATANKNCSKVKATSHPTYKTQPLSKGHMPIRRETCTEEACPLRPGPKGQAAEPRTGPPTPTEKDAFQTASCGRWPRCGRAQSLSRLYTVGGWEVGWGHRPCVIATANRHQAPK